MHAQAFPLGDYLKDELDFRGWGPDCIAGLEEERFEIILGGGQASLAEIEMFAHVFEVSPITLLNIQKAYLEFKKKS